MDVTAKLKREHVETYTTTARLWNWMGYAGAYFEPAAENKVMQLTFKCAYNAVE